jgi:hypothetical protein
MRPKGKKIDEMLDLGEIAAAILGNDMPSDPRISPLVPNGLAAAKRRYEREHVIPINHMFAVHRDLSKSRPDVIRELFKMIVASRAAANFTAAIPLFGLEANREAIGMAIDWSYEQKIVPRRLSVDELLDENTADLVAEETASWRHVAEAGGSVGFPTFIVAGEESMTVWEKDSRQNKSDDRFGRQCAAANNQRPRRTKILASLSETILASRGLRELTDDH